MKKLDRELGLFSVFSISTGAMLGPGIFVLPGLAYTIGGPSVIIAYILAGLLAIPAALNMAEMSTALPESGGPYLFLDRSLGPLAGTLTGLGTWISLILKSAFSLVGLGAYLLFFTGLPPNLTVQVALGIGILLIALNAFGAKKAGQVQTILVLLTIFVLIDFVGWGSINVQRDHFHPFFQEGTIGVIGAIAFVFVSYAGIAKVVSVAEEIKNPSRNIPWGITLSLGVMILIYSLVVYVIVGVVPVQELGHGTFKLMPLVQAGDQLGWYWGMEIMAGIAVLALASMANAGLMAASRFPLPLARDKVLPGVLSKISPTFSTPFISILLTGTIMILFITLFPVKNLAKLASTFLLIVFGLINLAVIVFRESPIEWYDPDFRAPLYPFLQLFGFLSCFVLIFFMGWFPLAGAGLLITGCLIWYYLYARPRVDRHGAFFRTPADGKEIELFQNARTSTRRKGESVIVPFFGLKDRSMLDVERRIQLAAALCDQEERLDVVDFVEVPEQSFLSGFDPEPEAYEALQQRVEMLKNEIDNEIHVDQVVTHSSRGALRNYAEEESPHWVVFHWMEPSPWQILIGIQKWWLEDLPCDALFFQDNEVINFDDIAVVVEPGPYDGEVLYAAEQIAKHFEGNVTFLNSVEEGDDSQYEFIKSYQKELQELMEGAPETEIIPEHEWHETLIERSAEFDLMLIGGRQNNSFFERNELISKNTRREFDCNYARIRSNLKTTESILKSPEEEEPDVSELLEDLGFVVRLDVSNKDELFKEIGNSFDLEGENDFDVEEALWDRESLQNTYIEDGVAFPHAIDDNFSETQFCLAILENPVPYAEDGEEVSLCGVTIGPGTERERHLKIIRKLSRVFVNEDLQKDLSDVSDYSKGLEVISRYL